MNALEHLPSDMWFAITRFCAEGLRRWFELQRVSKRFAARVRPFLRNFTVTLDRPVLITNLQQHQSHVRKLILRNSTQLGLRCIHHLSQLRELHLNTDTACLDVIEPLTSLQSLTINWRIMRLVDLTPLSRLLQLRSLSLENCRVWSGCLRTLTHLTSLTVVSCQFTNANIQDLSHLSQLENLDLSLLTTCDISPLGKLNLSRLKMSGCDMSNLRNQSLEMLDISRTYVRDLEWVSRFTNLKQLDVSFCDHILDARPLLKLKHLTDIYARGTKFTVVSYFTLSPRVNFHF
jgi:Leucine-rich repeat (LRR) protein